jgi:hypothetical protein
MLRDPKSDPIALEDFIPESYREVRDDALDATDASRELKWRASLAAMEALASRSTKGQ